MYRVIHFFTDLQDGNHPYNVGDTFPRQGMDVSDARIAELSSDRNKQRVPLIEAVTETTAEVDVENTAEAEEKPKRARKRKS